MSLRDLNRRARRMLAKLQRRGTEGLEGPGWRRRLTSGEQRARAARLLLVAKLRVELNREPSDAELLEARQAAGGDSEILLAMGPGACSFAARDLEAKGDTAGAQRMRDIAKKLAAMAAIAAKRQATEGAAP